MGRLRFLSKIEQTAAFLREELKRGQWSVEIPGKEELAHDLGVNAKTVGLALQLLEKEGLLVSQGSGRRRRIADVRPDYAGLKIKILMFDNQDRNRYLKQQLEGAGHIVTIAEKNLMDLGMQAKRVAHYAATIDTGAWIVTAAAHEVLEWFSRQKVPTFALFGQVRDLPLPAVRIDKITPLREAIRKLHALGHRRIVLLTRGERRHAGLPPFEQAFLDELKSLGITTGSYNLPEWASTPADFNRCMQALFGPTPPTALIVDETSHFLAAQAFLCSRGIVAPRDISMIVLEEDLSLSWCDPMVSHIRWDMQPLANVALKWANRVAAGNHDVRQVCVPGVFHEGCTIGPVPKK